MTILVTGGLGFIGSHICVELLKRNYRVVVIDNLSNSDISTLEKIHEITFPEKLEFYRGDIRDPTILCQIFERNTVTHVIHLAALKSVSESNKLPELYNDVNVSGTKLLLQLMHEYNVPNFIFSSSATVYGHNEYPVDETATTGTGLECVYAQNKYCIEQFLIHNTLPNMSVTILRYFNPIGAHPSGLLGENPRGTPNNVFPYLLKVVKGEYSQFTVFGNDYPTRDGTCVRDYIHVVDVATAHIAALSSPNQNSRVSIYNVGTGKGTTVLELIRELNRHIVKPISFQIGNRRDGDLSVCYSKVDKIYQELGWRAEYSLADMCRDGVRY